MPTVLPANHWLFQLANSFLAVSYVSFNILALRVALTCASLCFCLWGAFVLDISLDTTVWNAVFFCINAAQTARLVYELRPIDFKSEELEKLYKDVFGPEHFGLSRADFLRLSNAGYLRTLEAGNHYAEEGSHANSLSILISGSLHVIKSRGAGKKPVFFNSIVPNEFIDSPQWVSRKRVREGERFAVSIVAADTCRYLTWPRENLDALFAISPHLRACLDTLAGYDVALKLYRVDDSLVRANDEEDLLYPANRAHDLSSSRRSPTGGLGGSAAARPFQLESNVLSNC